MLKLSDDLIEIYNSLQEFSKETLEGPTVRLIKVSYEDSVNSLSFEQKGKKIYLPSLNYYSGSLRFLKDSWLFPEDYNILMATMESIISSGVLLHDRVCVSPSEYGFDIYETLVTSGEFKNGPKLLGEIRFASGNGWLFRLFTKFKYKKEQLL